MRAAVVEPGGLLRVREVPMPSYGPYEALVKLSYGATCAGTDQRLMEGKHPTPIPFPAVLGHESVGRVVETGAKVASFRPGDLLSRVGLPAMPELGLGSCWGGFAQYGVATDWRAMERDGLPRRMWDKARVQQVVPPDIPERWAPMIVTWRETYSYISRLGLGPGAQAVVIGSGANALAFVRHCACAGVRTVSVGSMGRSDLARSAGAGAVLDYKDPGLSEALRAACPRGLDLILDGVGAHGTVNQALPLLNEGGQVAVYGWNSRDSYGLDPFRAGRSFRVYCGGYDEAEAHGAVIGRIRSGDLDASLWYDTDHPVPLADIAGAYEGLRARKALKYLIDLT